LIFSTFFAFFLLLAYLACCFFTAALIDFLATGFLAPAIFLAPAGFLVAFGAFFAGF